MYIQIHLRNKGAILQVSRIFCRTTLVNITGFTVAGQVPRNRREISGSYLTASLSRIGEKGFLCVLKMAWLVTTTNLSLKALALYNFRLTSASGHTWTKMAYYRLQSEYPLLFLGRFFLYPLHVSPVQLRTFNYIPTISGWSYIPLLENKDKPDCSQYLPSMNSTGLRLTKQPERPQKFCPVHFNCQKWLC